MTLGRRPHLCFQASFTGEPSGFSSENTKISSEGRHRECPDLVCCILLFYRCSGNEANAPRRTCEALVPSVRPHSLIEGSS